MKEINKKEPVKQEKKSDDEKFDYSDMNDTTMNDLLVELAESKYWLAVLRYTDMRCILADNVLRSIDPFKNPTETARNQGFLTGSRDLEVYIKEEKFRRSKKYEE